MIAQLNNNVELYYEWVLPNDVVHPNKQATILLFLHEGLGSARQWKKFPQQLCAALNCQGLIYERQGYGNSSPLTELRDSSYLEHYAFEELPEFLTVINLKPEQLVLFGHSDGGSIALLFASKFKVKALISLAAHIFVEAITIEGILKAIKAYETTKLRLALTRYHGPKTDAIFYGWAHTWTNPEFKDWNISHYLTSISCPSFVAQGASDEYGSALQIDEICRLVGPKARPLILPDIGHSPHLENSAVVIELTKEFLEQEKVSL